MVEEYKDVLKIKLGHGILEGGNGQGKPGALTSLLRLREEGGKGNGKRMKRNFGCRKLPSSLGGIVDSFDGALFCGNFSGDGSLFMSCSQNAKISLFDTDQFIFQQHQHQAAAAYRGEEYIARQEPPSLKAKKIIHCRDVGWAIVGNAFSPQAEWVAYSSWSRYVHIANTRGDHEMHEAIAVSRGSRHFCLFSLAFTGCGSSIAGGGNDGGVHIINLERKQVSVIEDAHYDDINAVCFLSEQGNILLSGSDDALIKVWDLRERGTPKGLLYGHGHGITSIASKGNGIHVVSNSKDQTVKLWDLRVMADASASNIDAFSHDEDFDYRFDRPSSRRLSRARRRSSNDISLMTMTGHIVSRTLIRATFSPADWTGGRYVTSGSADGNVYTWDTMAGNTDTELDPMEVLNFHGEPVRSVDYHPQLPLLVSSSWDRTLGLWTYSSGSSQ